MTALITGASGCLGSYLMKSFGDSAVGCYRNNPVQGMKKMEILDQENVKSVFEEVCPDVVVHCAAESRADFAERKPYQTRQSNIEGTLNIFRAAKEQKSYLVYISSNAVFDGEYPPYREGDERYPANEYGRVKRDAEDIIGDYPFRSLIVRPIFLYGWVGKGVRRNMDTRVIETLGAGKKMQVATDIVTQPTYAADCADTIFRLVEQNREGTFHIASEEKMTLFDFCNSVANTFGLDCRLIEPVKAEIFKALAVRPKNTCYDLKKIRDMGIKLDNPKVGLQRMRDEKKGETK